MAKIIPFKSCNNDYANVTEFLQDFIQKLEDEKAVSCLLVIKTEDGFIITGYYKCDFGERLELLGHIQCDIIDQMIRANPDRYR